MDREYYSDSMMMVKPSRKISEGGNGKSAYEIWLDEGNTGTEADFLKSLQGEGFDPSACTLGLHTDGLLYIFYNGQPIGNGIALPSGTSGDVVGNVDSANNIIVTGNLPDGTYTVKYEMEDGTTVDIGNLVLDTNTYYSVTKNLTNCTINNSVTQVVEGGSYSATISANSGYTLDSVNVTMGGSPVSVSGGNINIASVTGDIVITAVASETVVEPSYTNLLPLSVDENGNDFVGQDAKGGDGYEYGYKLSGSSANGTTSATSGAYVSGFIPITDQYDVVRIKNITLYQGTSVNNIIFYDTSKAKLYAATGNTGNCFHSYVTESNGVYSFKPADWMAMSNIGFFRFSCGGITDETIVTVNEEIV